MYIITLPEIVIAKVWQHVLLSLVYSPVLRALIHTSAPYQRLIATNKPQRLWKSAVDFFFFWSQAIHITEIIVQNNKIYTQQNDTQ